MCTSATVSVQRSTLTYGTSLTRAHLLFAGNDTVPIFSVAWRRCALYRVPFAVCVCGCIEEDDDTYGGDPDWLSDDRDTAAAIDDLRDAVQASAGSADTGTSVSMPLTRP